MTDEDKFDAVLIAVLAVTIGLVGAAFGRILSASTPRFDASLAWYVRLRAFDVTTEVFALGCVAYVFPRTRLSGVAARLAAAFAVIGAAATIGEWVAASGQNIATPRVALAMDNLASLVALAAVIGMWFVGRRGAASDEVAPADLA